MNTKASKPVSSIDNAIEAMLNEWKRGMLSFWTLCLLMQRPSYGLEISKQIERSTEGRLKLGASTIYPLLRRMERRGLINSRWERAPEGPPRAYYKITPGGRRVVERFMEDILMPDAPINRALSALLEDLMRRPRRDA